MYVYKWFTQFRRPPDGARACDDRGSYLVTVGTAPHRAWVAAQSFLDAYEGLLGCLRGASWSA
eukprot:7292480-Pyramimonas_sp.AAC.1